uniref:F-box associated beta-propeller type 3 domain-containing protein n=1 Tax=Brassica campestris TaxID=3711 RepID=M4DCX0_BRACM
MVFQSWRKNRSEDHDTWSESCCCCNMRGEVHDTWSESCCCNMRRKDTALWGWRKKRRRDNDVSLNDDLLEEIMSRLPVKALTFQVVSKQWRLQEGPAVYHIEPQIDQHARLSGSCDGFVCIFDENNLTSPIIVANPAMVRSQVLPLSQFQRQCLEDKKKSALHFPGLGKDDVTGTYKLVWLHNNQSNYTLSCEVFDFEVRKWRYMVVNTPSDDVPVFSKGWLYWIIANLTNYEYKILGYNIHTEMFRVFTNRIVSQATYFLTITMCSLSDRVWVTNNMPDGGMQHFWRIKNTMDSEWESEKMFSIDLNLISPWFKDISTATPFITLKATSKDNKNVLISRLFSSNFVHLLPRPTGKALGFGSAFTGLSNSIFIPYFQSLLSIVN